jgi:hypothetical protein
VTTNRQSFNRLVSREILGPTIRHHHDFMPHSHKLMRLLANKFLHPAKVRMELAGKDGGA